MKIYRDTKIYVLCPANLHTGGPESLHQLASQLITFGVETYMLYSVRVDKFFDADNPVDDALKKYHVPYVFSFEDAPHNVLIVPEALTDIAVTYAKKCRRVIWWMSVDNYLNNILDLIQRHLTAPLAEPVPKFFYFDDAEIEHWGQSEYVRQFLRVNGVKKIRAVETHMSQIFLHGSSHVNLSAKKNFVAYNPRKGFEFTEKLIELAPDIDWRPIENMMPAQVQKILSEAKIYIDFGNFPGRERLPREATLCGCVVMTGKRGASANDIDINIPAEFKFDTTDFKPRDVLKKIRAVFDDFESACVAQKNFRDKELNAQKKFATQIAAAFEIKNFPPPTVALVQGVGEQSFLLAEDFSRRGDFVAKFIVDDVLAATKISDGLLLREQNRNYLRVGNNPIEIITRHDAKFLYREGRIKNFALFAPSADELSALKNFYESDDADVLIFGK